MLSLCTLGGPCVLDATGRSYSFSMVLDLGKKLDVIGHVDEEHWVFVCRCGNAVAGDVVLLMVVGLGSSIVDNVLRVSYFFLK